MTESLQQQTATADVLKVISRSTFDLQAVLDTLVKSAVQLCEADMGHIARPNESGFFQIKAHFGLSTDLKEELERIRFKPGRKGVTSRALLERTTVQIVDAATDPEYKLSKLLSVSDYHSMIGTPLLREGIPIGVFGLARHAVRPFTDKQMALLTTFADQAVIAIENARLFDEVRARTEELSEALRQQTATADVLQVIGGSAFNLQPVFDTVAESSVKLCDAERAMIWRYDGELLRMVGQHREQALHARKPVDLWTTQKCCPQPHRPNSSRRQFERSGNQLRQGNARVPPQRQPSKRPGMRATTLPPSFRGFGQPFTLVAPRGPGRGYLPCSSRPPLGRAGSSHRRRDPADIVERTKLQKSFACISTEGRFRPQILEGTSLGDDA
jgi:hypothetical protein